MVSKILAESTISKLLSSLQLHKKIGWVQIGKIRLPKSHRYHVQIIRESNYQNNISDKVIQEFIGTYLIPKYEQEYVDSTLRKDFYKIVDEAEKEYLEDK